MAQSLITKSGPNGPFVYIENNIANSLAFGADDANAVYTLNTSAVYNVVPDETTANIIFDPTANGNLTFRPNGSGKINALNVASGVVANKNYVTINTVTGELGSDSGATNFVWTVTTVDANAVASNGYIANKAGLLTMTLPATSAIGDIIKITGINTAVGWRIAQNANQQIFFGSSSTTVGVAGSITSTAIRDSLEIVCVVAGASSNWNVINAVGNLTVV
jgi:hypothetical protein